jgi:hypothetical protein
MYFNLEWFSSSSMKFQHHVSLIDSANHLISLMTSINSSCSLEFRLFSFPLRHTLWLINFNYQNHYEWNGICKQTLTYEIYTYTLITWCSTKKKYVACLLPSQTLFSHLWEIKIKIFSTINLEVFLLIIFFSQPLFLIMKKIKL